MDQRKKGGNHEAPALIVAAYSEHFSDFMMNEDIFYIQLQFLHYGWMMNEYESFDLKNYKL